MNLVNKEKANITQEFREFVCKRHNINHLTLRRKQNQHREGELGRETLHQQNYLQPVLKVFSESLTWKLKEQT